MSTDRYAILLDGGFVVPKLKRKLRRFPTADDVIAACARIGADHSLQDLKLLRIYFYNAPPYTELIVNPISKTKAKHDAIALERIAAWTSLHDKLELMPDVALRMGETVCHGWKLTRKALEQMDGKKPVVPADLIPHIEQKGVDLRIGLDIARLALNKLVSTLVVVSGDSDLIPAFKFARREGVRVFLDHMQHGVRRDLKVHADRILDVACKVPASAIAKVAAHQAQPAAAAGAAVVPKKLP